MHDSRHPFSSPRKNGSDLLETQPVPKMNYLSFEIGQVILPSSGQACEKTSGKFPRIARPPRQGTGCSGRSRDRSSPPGEHLFRVFGMTGKKRLDRRTSPVIPLIFPGSIRPGIILPDPSHGLTGTETLFLEGRADCQRDQCLGDPCPGHGMTPDNRAKTRTFHARESNPLFSVPSACLAGHISSLGVKTSGTSSVRPLRPEQPTSSPSSLFRVRTSRCGPCRNLSNT